MEILTRIHIIIRIRLKYLKLYTGDKLFVLDWNILYHITTGQNFLTTQKIRIWIYNERDYWTIRLKITLDGLVTRQNQLIN